MADERPLDVRRRPRLDPGAGGQPGGRPAQQGVGSTTPAETFASSAVHEPYSAAFSRSTTPPTPSTTDAR
ncbi:hypothetical protein [Halobaculum litoreum]|uniref:Uncharacterized protein n=1 Tax=Halobaculum litoreum TaxID=3031998 RepID=A0ABD5XNM9_9EURY|nr:hypothetical protein [Halobaculum sp. DT92]